MLGLSFVFLCCNYRTFGVLLLLWSFSIVPNPWMNTHCLETKKIGPGRTNATLGCRETCTGLWQVGHKKRTEVCVCVCVTTACPVKSLWVFVPHPGLLVLFVARFQPCLPGIKLRTRDAKTQAKSHWWILVIRSKSNRGSFQSTLEITDHSNGTFRRSTTW